MFNESSNPYENWQIASDHHFLNIFASIRDYEDTDLCNKLYIEASAIANIFVTRVKVKWIAAENKLKNKIEILAHFYINLWFQKKNVYKRL